MINNLADLRKFLKLCRAQGVTEITAPGFVIKFGSLPISKGDGDEVDDGEDFPHDELSPEQLAFYSAPTPHGMP